MDEILDYQTTLPSGEVVFRDKTTGEEHVVSQDIADQVYAAGSAKPPFGFDNPQTPAPPAAPPPGAPPSTTPTQQEIQRRLMPGAEQGVANAINGPIASSGPIPVNVDNPVQSRVPAQAGQPPSNRVRVQGRPQNQSNPNEGLIVERVPASKGGFLPVSRTTAGEDQSTIEGWKQRYEDIHNQSLNVLQEEFDARQARAEEAKWAAKVRANDSQERLQKAEAHKLAISNQVQTRRAELDRRRAAASTMEVDPDKIWKEKGVVASVLAAVAEAAGAFGAGLTGGENHAGKLINNMVERSVRAQEVNIDKTQRDLDRDEFAFNRNVLPGKEQADNEAKLLRLESAQAILDAQAKDDALAYLKPQFEAAKLDLERRKQELLMTFDQANTTTATEAYRPPTAETIRVKPDPLYKARAEVAGYKKAINEVDNSTSKNAVRDPNGNVLGYSDDAPKLNEMADNTADLMDALRQYRDVHANGSSASPTNRSRAKNLRSTIIVALNAQNKLGALDNGTLEVLKENVPEYGLTVNEAAALESIDTTMRTVQTKLNNAYRRRGFRPPDDEEVLR